MASLDQHLSVLSQAMNLRTQRHQVLASNIANADTPGYKARDFSFESAMQNAMAGRATGGEAGEIPRQSNCKPPLRSSTSPVMNPDNGDTRKPTTCANSSGSQNLPTGMSLSSFCRCSSLSCSVIMGVLT